MNGLNIKFYRNSDDIPMKEDELCAETFESWTFKWIKGKLKFRKLNIAG